MNISSASKIAWKTLIDETKSFSLRVHALALLLSTVESDASFDAEAIASALITHKMKQLSQTGNPQQDGSPKRGAYSTSFLDNLRKESTTGKPAHFSSFLSKLESQSALVHNDYLIKIEDEVLLNQGQLFDTRAYKADNKKGFAAFTLNDRGALVVLNQHDANSQKIEQKLNQKAHVVARGEIFVKEGKIKALAFKAGNNSTSLFQMYLFMQHLQKAGYSLSSIKVFFNEPQNIESISWDKHASGLYYTNALELFQSLNILLKQTVNIFEGKLSEAQDSAINELMYNLLEQAQSELSDTSLNMDVVDTKLEYLHDILTLNHDDATASSRIAEVKQMITMFYGEEEEYTP